MIVMMEQMEMQKAERLESLYRILDSVYNDPVEEEEPEIPTGREKQERVILLTMMGL